MVMKQIERTEKAIEKEAQQADIEHAEPDCSETAEKDAEKDTAKVLDDITRNTETVMKKSFNTIAWEKRSGGKEWEVEY